VTERVHATAAERARLERAAGRSPASRRGRDDDACTGGRLLRSDRWPDDPEDLRRRRTDLTTDRRLTRRPEVGRHVEIVGLCRSTRTTASTAAEREIGSGSVLDVRFDVGEPEALVTDRVEDTVDYGEVCQVIALIRPARSYKTLERPVRGDRRPPRLAVQAPRA
jgi:dihydroneopterin aldolase